MANLFLGFVQVRKQRKRVKNIGGVGLGFVKIKYVYSFLRLIGSLFSVAADRGNMIKVNFFAFWVLYFGVFIM